MRRTSAFLALSICGAAVSSASVITEASAGINFTNATAYYAYNGTNGLAAGTGTHSYGGCTNGSNFTCSASFNGTQDSSGTLPSSFDSVTMTAHIDADSVGHPAVDGSATGYAFANTANATVGVSATGTSNSVSGFEEGGGANGQAGVGDTLHFRVAGASANTVTLIPVSYTVSGFLTGASGEADVDAQLHLGSASFDEMATLSAPSFVPAITRQSASGWSSYTVTQSAPGSFTFSGLYAVTGSSADLGIFEYLAADGGGGATSQFSHTGIVSFNLGSNVSFTSDSGVFLTQTTAAAPEPASFGLLASGVFGLIVWGRKRRLASGRQ